MSVNDMFVQVLLTDCDGMEANFTIIFEGKHVFTTLWDMFTNEWHIGYFGDDPHKAPLWCDTTDRVEVEDLSDWRNESIVKMLEAIDWKEHIAKKDDFWYVGQRMEDDD